MPTFTRRARTPLMFQMEATECGAACLAAVLRHFGHWVSLEEMREACDVGRDGCSAADIVRAARQYGLQATGWRQDMEDLPGLSLPAILFWEFRHFVVLEGIGKRGYHLNDPSRGRRVVDRDGFDRAFTGVALELGPGESFHRTGRPPGVLRRLWPWVSGFRRSLLFAILAGLLLAAPGVAAPILLGLFVDDVLAGAQSGWSGVLVGAMAAAAAVAYLLTWLRVRALRRLSVAVAVRQADRFVGRLLGRSARFFARRMAGDLLSRMHSIERVVTVGVRQSVGVTVELAMSLAFLSLMFVYDATLAAVVVLIAVSCAIAARLASRWRTDDSHALRREHGLWTGVGLGGLRIIETIRATASEDGFYARWGGHQARELNARQRFEELGHVTEAVPVLFTALGGAAVLAIGGWYASSSAMPLGSLIAFYVLAWNFLQPVGRFVQFAELVRTLDAELARLEEVLDPRNADFVAPDARSAPPDAGSEAEPPAAPGVASVGGRLRLRGRVEMRDVTFGFQRYRPPLIDRFNLTIEPGQCVAIVGPSGSGKSTLSLLAAGIYRPWSGEILFDGMSRAEIPRAVLNDSIAVVTQDTALIAGSVRDNLTLWDPNVPDPQVIGAARDAAIHDEIIARSGGYDAEVEERGRNFSGGQRQRLEIARALVTGPSLLILDEATAALDAVTEMRIDDALRRRGCSCLIVAHRLSTIRDCDRIIVLDGGRAVQEGVHDDLIAAEGGLYRELVHAS
ncbi:MAG: cysteine peptidase family C39 domain-containing protein [Spirochaetaceae bacterium]|nr:cysteine peptidase family C39 domain-containing protein [Spirochaetaceae bacterium]